VDYADTINDIPYSPLPGRVREEGEDEQNCRGYK
jgi:hypothetical protein